MNSSLKKPILWAGLGAREHYSVYSHQISGEYEHILVEEIDLESFDSETFHCCFVFCGILEQSRIIRESSLHKPNVFLFLDTKSIVDFRTNYPRQPVQIDTENFRFFSNDHFVEICMDFDLIAFTISINDDVSQVTPLTLHLNVSNAINEINVWTKASGFSCQLLARDIIKSGSPINRYFDTEMLIRDFTYIGGISPENVFQILFPSSSEECKFRHYLTALAKRLGPAKTLAISNLYKPLHKLLAPADDNIELYKISAQSGDEKYPIFLMFKQREL